MLYFTPEDSFRQKDPRFQGEVKRLTESETQSIFPLFLKLQSLKKETFALQSTPNSKAEE